jgi:hypothetical protein
MKFFAITAAFAAVAAAHYSALPVEESCSSVVTVTVTRYVFDPVIETHEHSSNTHFAASCPITLLLPLPPTPSLAQLLTPRATHPCPLPLAPATHPSPSWAVLSLPVLLPPLAPAPTLLLPRSSPVLLPTSRLVARLPPAPLLPCSCKECDFWSRGGE